MWYKRVRLTQANPLSAGSALIAKIWYSGSSSSRRDCGKPTTFSWIKTFVFSFLWMQAQAIKQEILWSSLPSRAPSLLNGWHGVPDISTSAKGRGCSPQQGHERASERSCSLFLKFSNPGKSDSAGQGLKLLNTLVWMCDGAHARCCKILRQEALSSQAETETKLPPKASGSLDAW